MSLKKIHIIYAKNPEEVFSRKAALGSYIFALAGLLQESGAYDVFVNGIHYPLMAQKDAHSLPAVSGYGFLKSLIPPPLKRFLKERRMLQRMEALRQKLIPVPCDLILEFYSLGSDLGQDLSVKKKVPLLVVYDAPVFEEYRIFQHAEPFHKKMMAGRERDTLLAASTTIVYSSAVSDFLRRSLQKEIPVVIHQNIDFTRFDVIHGKKFPAELNIGFIGSFLKWHRVDLLLNAFERLREKRYQVRLFLLGAGEEEERIRTKVAGSRYRDSIVMPGFTDGKELLEYKQKIHIGVMPGSNWYGAPNKIFEYGAAGMGVVAPATPTITELFKNEEEVLLFREGNGEELYASLKRLCDEPLLLSEISAALQKKINANYSKNNTFELYNKLITDLLS